MTLHPDTLATLYAPSSPSVAAIAAALAKAQGAMQNAAKTSVNPQTNSSYADLTTVLDVARGPLAENGLSVVQAPYQLPGSVDSSTGQVTPASTVLVTTIFHESGEWIRSVMPVNGRKQKPRSEGGGFEERDDMASIGAAISYARRYALVSMLGVGQDDGEEQVSRPAATGNRQQAPQRQQARTPQQAAPARQAAPADADGPMNPGQSKALASRLTGLEVDDGDAPAFVGWILGRKLADLDGVTYGEAMTVLKLKPGEWEEKLVEYAASAAGDEPDFSGIGSVKDGAPVEFDAKGNAVRQPRRGANA